jgi:hypothetical protein
MHASFLVYTAYAQINHDMQTCYIILQTCYKETKHQTSHYRPWVLCECIDRFTHQSGPDLHAIIGSD